jgi:serine/threonine kinase 4
VKKCLIVDPKRRPTSKELLLDPFIAKSKGPALLSELVANSLEDIERYRSNQNEEENENEDAEGGNEGLQTFVGITNTIGGG